MHDSRTLGDIMRRAVAFAGFRVLPDEGGRGIFDAAGMKFAWQAGEASGNDGPEAVTVWCSIGTLDDRTPPETVGRLLELNLFGAGTRGGNIGLYRPTRALIYSFRLRARNEPVEETAAALAAFTETAASLVREAGMRQDPVDMPLFGADMLWV